MRCAAEEDAFAERNVAANNIVVAARRLLDASGDVLFIDDPAEARKMVRDSVMTLIHMKL